VKSDFAHLYPTSFGKYPFPKVLKYRHLRLLGKLLGDFCAFGKDDFPKVKGCNILFTSFIVLFKKGCNILFLLGKSSFPADSTNSYVQSHFLLDTLAAEQAPARSQEGNTTIESTAPLHHKVTKAIQPLKALPTFSFQRYQ
jgi:hypothetical protein